MNALDRLIAWFSPERGYRRSMYRDAFERNYDASRTDRRNENWVPISATAEATDAGHRDLIRTRARDLERNNDILESALLRRIPQRGHTPVRCRHARQLDHTLQRPAPLVMPEIQLRSMKQHRTNLAALHQGSELAQIIDLRTGVHVFTRRRANAAGVSAAG